MKKVYLTLLAFVSLLLLCSTHPLSQSNKPIPEHVYRIVYIQKPNEWYIQQAELWEKEIQKNPKNPEAWYNYYNAVRYANYEETIGTKDKKARLKQIIEDMGKAIPGTYEYYLLNFWNTYCFTDISLIEKAYELNPKRVDTYYAFISYYEFEGSEQKMKEFCQKLYQSRDIAPGLINYNYNVIMSTEKDAILFTNGDNDTYPLWVLQKALGIREDVTVLNISISRSDRAYLERKLKMKGIIIDFDKLPGLQDDRFLRELSRTLCKKYPDHPVYFALTVYENFTKDFTDDLYIVGLDYQYCTKRIDNLALIKKNLETNLRLDYLKYDWYSEGYLANGIVSQLNANYIAPAIMLAEHYKASGEREKAMKWKDWALFIAEKCGKKELIEEIKKKGL
jgi:hypothetical protein